MRKMRERWKRKTRRKRRTRRKRKKGKKESLNADVVEESKIESKIAIKEDERLEVVNGPEQEKPVEKVEL